MGKPLDIRSLASGEVLARQGEDANAVFVLQSGSLSSRLAPEKLRKDDGAVAQMPPMETWEEPGLMLATESVLLGRYVESIVADRPTNVLVVPMDKKSLVGQLTAAPRACLGFGRSLARRVMAANKNLTSSQSAVNKLEQEVERYYTDFAGIVDSIAADAEGDDLVADALKNAKGSKTYSTGKRLSDSAEEAAVTMTRVIENYEMTGRQHKLKKGEALCRKGDPGNSMFVVVKGKLAVLVDGERVGEIGPGEMVGEIAVLLGKSDQKRTADLIAEDTTVVGIIPSDQFEKLATLQPAMVVQIANSLAKRIDNNFAVVSDREAKERKIIERFLAKSDVKLEEDYRAFAAKLEKLIEEFELPLYREMELLERGADKIAALKERYSNWLPQAK